MGGTMYGAPYPMNPDVNLVRQLLSVGRILALVFAVIGVIAIILSALSIASYAAFWGYVPGYFYAGPVYWGITTLVNFLTWMQLRPVEQQFGAGQYAQARDHLLIWMILTLIFGVLIGILLIIAYVKLDQIGRTGMPQGMGMAPGAVSPPSPYGTPSPSVQSVGPPMAAAPYATPSPPVAAPPPMPSTAAPAVPTCPKCGRPATWVAQYSRWYCYTDAQYL